MVDWFYWGFVLVQGKWLHPALTTLLVLPASSWGGNACLDASLHRTSHQRSRRNLPMFTRSLVQAMSQSSWMSSSLTKERMQWILLPMKLRQEWGIQCTAVLVLYHSSKDRLRGSRRSLMQQMLIWFVTPAMRCHRNCLHHH